MTILKILLAVAAALTALVAYGAYQWANGTSDLRARLEAARVPITPATVDFRELEALPDVVRRYFRLVLKEGQPMVAGVRWRPGGAPWAAK